MSVTITRQSHPDPAAWDRMWAQCDYATFFHSRYWLEAWDRYTGGARADDSRHVVFSDGAEAIVVLSKRRRAAGLLATYESGPRGTYGGWISDPRGVVGPEHARALVDYITGLGDVEWYTNPFDPNAAVIHAAGGVDDVTDAIELDRDFDALFHTWSKGHRAAVKQAQRSGVTVRCARGPDDWRAYYGAYEDSHRRWGDAASERIGWDLFETLSQLPSELVRLWLAVLDDTVVAGALCFYAARHVVYWHGSAYSEHFKKRPVNLLVHDAALDACERGYRWFDFNPSGGLEGVRSFKTSFGTREFFCPTIRRESTATRLVRRVRRGE